MEDREILDALAEHDLRLAIYPLVSAESEHFWVGVLFGEELICGATGEAIKDTVSDAVQLALEIVVTADELEEGGR